MRCKVGEGELENVSVLRTYRMDGHLRDFDGFKRFVNEVRHIFGHCDIA